MKLVDRLQFLIPALVASLLAPATAHAKEEPAGHADFLFGNVRAIGDAESRQFVNSFQLDYAISASVHDITSAPRESLISLIESELRTYQLISKSKVAEETGEKWEEVRFDTEIVGKLIREGRDYAIVSPVAAEVMRNGDVWISPATKAPWVVQSVRESFRLVEGGKILQLTAHDKLKTKVETTIASLGKLVNTATSPRESGSAYRLEVALLKGGKAGEVATTSQWGIGLNFGMQGTISRLPKVGEHVEQGEEIAALDTSIIMAEANLEGGNEAELAAYLRTMVIIAPVAGTIGSLEIQTLQVRQGEMIATLIPDGASATEGAAVRYSAQVAERYGIAPEDVEMFGFDGFVEMGKSIFWLSRNDGEDRSEFALGDEYQCELIIQDYRPPYLVLSAQLAGQGKNLATTIYLEQGTPSVVGITNMTEALVLVINITKTR